MPSSRHNSKTGHQRNLDSALEVLPENDGQNIHDLIESLQQAKENHRVRLCEGARDKLVDKYQHVEALCAVHSLVFQQYLKQQDGGDWTRFNNISTEGQKRLQAIRTVADLWKAELSRTPINTTFSIITRYPAIASPARPGHAVAPIINTTASIVTRHPAIASPARLGCAATPIINTTASIVTRHPAIASPARLGCAATPIINTTASIVTRHPAIASPARLGYAIAPIITADYYHLASAAVTRSRQC
ncbi:hypothetical protein F5883DRAFT_654917 [Diaporthe sp. PMI_573]|nr:hypothetical protein F5883DRAFT_654917 [Diaporthaceae sp. PMI_573]